MKTDNSTASSFVNKKIRVKRSKAWDMRYNWLRDQLQQHNFDIFWAKSEDIESDYYLKHFTAHYHRQKRPTHVLDKV